MKMTDTVAGNDGWRSAFFTTDVNVKIHKYLNLKKAICLSDVPDRYAAEITKFIL
jgi:hypothetical protein